MKPTVAQSKSCCAPRKPSGFMPRLEHPKARDESEEPEEHNMQQNLVPVKRREVTPLTTEGYPPVRAPGLFC